MIALHSAHSSQASLRQPV